MRWSSSIGMLRLSVGYLTWEDLLSPDPTTTCEHRAAAIVWGTHTAITRSTLADDEERSEQVNLLRDIFGNPFRPVIVDPTWLTATVTALGRSIYDERAFDRMPILGDALEDAGCTSQEILATLSRAWSACSWLLGGGPDAGQGVGHDRGQVAGIERSSADALLLPRERSTAQPKAAALRGRVLSLYLAPGSRRAQSSRCRNRRAVCQRAGHR